VRLRLPDAPAPLAGDPLLLERAVRNLLANAVDAARAAGADEPVELALGTAGGGWELAVEDRGAGVPAALAARLFEPFVSGRPGGVGLGLALARRIAVLHGGELDFAPREGGGSRFALRLPAHVADNSAT